MVFLTDLSEVGKILGPFLLKQNDCQVAVCLSNVVIPECTCYM